MTIKSILFNTEMVRAILDGRKSCTRLVIKLPENMDGVPVGKSGDSNNPLGFMYPGGIKRPPYQPGDILYVRETWSEGYEDGTYIYRADDKLADLPTFKESSKLIYHPSIHMPKEAARIWLKVTDVRVEWLHEITEDGALREGAQGVRCNHARLGVYGCTDCMNTGWLEPPEIEFMYIWDSTIKKPDLDQYGWDANPWVWVIEFERCEKPEGV